MNIMYSIKTNTKNNEEMEDVAVREIKIEGYGTFKIKEAPIIKTKKGDLKLPAMTTILVPTELVQANNYNPNHVDKNNMELLQTGRFFQHRKYH